tara:strand:+ start:647 stop:988 length:342 start_codon:yes stop_codon:yes gene_type:complete
MEQVFKKHDADQNKDEEKDSISILYKMILNQPFKPSAYYSNLFKNTEFNFSEEKIEILINAMNNSLNTFYPNKKISGNNKCWYISNNNTDNNQDFLEKKIKELEYKINQLEKR